MRQVVGKARNPNVAETLAEVFLALVLLEVLAKKNKNYNGIGQM